MGSGADHASQNGNGRVAVLIPCYNEEVALGRVIDDFKRELPGAAIVVFDNDSSDRSAWIAREHGALVVREPRRGKGFVVRRMFEEAPDVDFFVMVDGDATYDAGQVQRLLDPLRKGEADLAIGTRVQRYSKGSFRPLHLFGNRLVCAIVNRLFNARITDIFSGYRAFNQRLMRGVPVSAEGFEIETEMTVNCLYYGFNLAEVTTPYYARPAGSYSKLRTVPDGFRVLRKLFCLCRAYRPLAFFVSIAMALLVAAVLVGLEPTLGLLQSPVRQWDRLPQALVGLGIMFLAAVSLSLGLVLEPIRRRLRGRHRTLTTSSSLTQRQDARGPLLFS